MPSHITLPAGAEDRRVLLNRISYHIFCQVTDDTDETLGTQPQTGDFVIVDDDFRSVADTFVTCDGVMGHGPGLATTNAVVGEMAAVCRRPAVIVVDGPPCSEMDALVNVDEIIESVALPPVGLPPVVEEILADQPRAPALIADYDSHSSSDDEDSGSVSHGSLVLDENEVLAPDASVAVIAPRDSDKLVIFLHYFQTESFPNQIIFQNSSKTFLIVLLLFSHWFFLI